MKYPTSAALAAALAMSSGAALAEQGPVVDPTPGDTGPQAADVATDRDPAPDAPADEEEKDAFPINASFGVSYIFSHSNFAEAEDDSVGFGTQLLSFNTGISYTIIDTLSVSAGVSAFKELDASFERAGVSSNEVNATELNDATVGVAYANFYKIPVADIGFTGAVNFTLPASRMSRSAGLIMSIGPSLTASWTKWGLTASATAAWGYNVNEEATVQIDCERAPENCDISGADLGQPNSLHSLAGNFALAYQIIEGLSVSAAYNIANGYGAVEFPDDEFTPQVDGIQTGQQEGLGLHGTSFGVSYNFWEGASVAGGMLTTKTLHSKDNRNLTNPFFDTESQLHGGTRYSLTLSYAL